MAEFGNIGNIRVSVIADTTKFERQLRAAIARAQRSAVRVRPTAAGGAIGGDVGGRLGGGATSRGTPALTAASFGGTAALLNKQSQSLNKLSAAADKASNRMNKFKRSMDRTRPSITKLDKGITGLRNRLLNIRTAFATLALGAAGVGVIRIADQMDNLNARLRIVTESQQEFNEAQALIFELAQRNFAPLEQVTELYVRLSLAGKNLGLATSETAKIVDGLTKSLAISGSVAAEAAGTILQFSQAIAGNFSASAQEFNSILEQSPRLAGALADGLNELAEKNLDGLADRMKKVGFQTQITTGNLKKLGEKGAIDAIDVLNALISQLRVLEEEFKNVPVTAGRGFQRLSNAFKKQVDEANKTAEANRAIGETFERIAKIVESPGFQAGLEGILKLVSKIADSAGDAAETTSELGRTLRLLSARLEEFDDETVDLSFITGLDGIKLIRDSLEDVIRDIAILSGLEVDPFSEVGSEGIFAPLVGNFSIEGLTADLARLNEALETSSERFERLARARKEVVGAPGGKFGPDPFSGPFIKRKDGEVGGPDEEELTKLKKARDALNDLVRSRQEDILLLGEEGLARDALVDQLQAEDIARGTLLAGTEELRQKQEQLRDINQELASRTLSDLI
jgi:tape measure domain-containing protein